MLQARAQFREAIAQVPAERLVFLDESGVSTSMTRTRARAAGGARARGSAPGGHWKITSILGAISRQGVRCAASLPAAVDGASFLKWVREILAPTLHEGELVLLDNLGAHKVPGVAQAIEATGARLRYLPPYSPDYNPIEPCWAKLKQLLRSAAARSQATLEQATATAFATITAQDLHGFFRGCGYG